ncbi:MarC family protein [Candidatus Woesearchaeota archaeon]|nr:MarC family protein [Candidatus Woesearchaeota archaeon]
MALLIILDPFLCVVVFISLTKGMNKTEKAKQAFIAVSVAFGLLIFFLFLGLWLLDLMGISFPSFIVAGGVILLILGVQSVLGIEFSKKDNSHKKVAAIVIGTPLLSGPGAMTTVIILSQHYGYWPPLIALILSLGITWIMMIWSEKITKLMGARLIEVISRVLGLILAALAIEFVKNGVSEMIKAFK